MRELLRRIGYIWNRRRREEEMAEEMEYHRELMPQERRADFGSGLRLREDARQIWGWVWLDNARQDLAYGARMLRKSPGFTITAVLVLALGIGVPLTVFRAALSDLQGGPAPDPDTLVNLRRRAPGAFITNLPYPELAFYAANAKSFRNVIGISERNQAVFGEIAAAGAPEQIQVAFATSNYFPEFGISPIHGRLFGPGDDRPDSGPVALIGELFWQRRFGKDPAAVGQDIRVNGKLVRVAGVLPRSARARAEVWMPLVRQPYVVEGSALFNDWNSALDVYARLKPGVSVKASEQETRALAGSLRQLRPDYVRAGEYLEAHPILQFETNGPEFQIVLTSVALVLLLLAAACANLGTLVLARGVTREREILIRMAVGAGRARVVRQLFTESALLAILAGLCGLALSSAVLKWIQLQHNPASNVLPDWRTAGVTFGVSLLSALIFGLPPALRLTSLAPRAGRARTIFLAAQVGASSLLLVVSGLMVNCLERLSHTDPGFDYRHLVSISPGLKAHGYGAATAKAYLDSLRERAAASPEVKAMSQVWLAPWGNVHMGSAWKGRQFAGNHVDPQFLDTMRMRLVRGRNFLRGEQGVAMISEAAARVLWPDGDALGKSLPWDAPGETVVGVVSNASTTAVGNPEPLEFYLPQSPGDALDSILLVRVSGRSHDFIRTFQDAARTLDARLQPAVLAISDAYDDELKNTSRALAAIAILGSLAIVLSAIGLAGLAGFTVAHRTREIGVRIALGARATHVVRAILVPMSHAIVFGFVFGSLGGSAVARLLRSGMPAMAGINVFDPFAYLMAMAFFAVVVALSIVAPGRRAIRIDPSKALQHE